MTKFSLIIDKMKPQLLITIFYSTCFFICCYQVFKIFQIYFSYHTITTVSYEHEQLIGLPGATICIKKQYLVRDRSKTDNLSEDQVLAFINQMTVKEQFRALLTAKEAFEMCEVMRPLYITDVTTPYVNCTRVSPIVRSIDFLRMCYAILTQRTESNVRPLVENVRSFRDFSPALIRLQFIKSIPKVEIFLHHRKEVIQNYYNHLFLEVCQMDNMYQFFR